MRKFIGAVGLVAFAAAACGSTEPASESSSSTPTSIEVDSVPSTVVQDYDPEATFTFIYSGDSAVFDPDKITTNNSYLYLLPVYDTLVFINEEAVPEPQLAKSWELGADGKSLTLELIQDWHFHDGVPFNADAVKKNIERSKTLPGSYNANRLTLVDSVEAVGEYTVRINTSTSAAPLVGILGGSAGMMMSPAAFDKAGEDRAPTGGSGAHRMVEYVPGQRVTYERVDDYWDPEAARVATTVISISGDDNARLNAVITGQADATFLRPAMVQPAKDAGLVIHSKPTLTTYALHMNTARSEFADARVRQALNYAIDREAFSVLLEGLCAPNSSAVFADFYWAGSKDAASRYTYDPEQAEALLAEAGLADGFSFTMQTVNISAWVQMAELVQQNLAAIGVDVVVQPVELLQMTSSFSVDKTSDAMLVEIKADSDPSVMTSLFFLPTGSLNPGGFSDPDVTALHEEALQGATPEERGPIYQELVERATELAYPTVGLCQLTVPFASNDRVQGLPVPADGSRWFRGVSIKPN